MDKAFAHFGPSASEVGHHVGIGLYGIDLIGPGGQEFPREDTASRPYFKHAPQLAGFLHGAGDARRDSFVFEEVLAVRFFSL